jgi:hypothetical protein
MLELASVVRRSHGMARLTWEKREETTRFAEGIAFWPGSATSPKDRRTDIGGSHHPARSAPGLARLPPLADDPVVVSRCVDVDQAAFVVNGHVDEPISPGVHHSSRTQSKGRAAKGIEHGAIK